MVGSREGAVLAAEEERCKALIARDFDRLRKVISRDLTHTHTGGNTESYEHYFSLLQGPMQYINIERRDVRIRFFGSVAVMDGVAITTGRMGEGQPMTLETKVLQAWVEAGEGWQMVAFQATIIT